MNNDFLLLKIFFYIFLICGILPSIAFIILPKDIGLYIAWKFNIIVMVSFFLATISLIMLPISLLKIYFDRRSGK